MKPPQISEKLWNKDPKAAMLIFLASVNFGLMYLLFNGGNKQADIYKQQSQVYFQMYEEQRNKADSFAIIDFNQKKTIEQMPYTFDSLLHSKTENSIKRILKNSK